MPTVPMVKQGSVKQEALPGVRVNTQLPLSAFGGGEAADAASKSMRDFGNTVKEIAIQQQNRADEVRLQDADLEQSKAQTDILTKAKSMYGKDALGAPDYVNQEWKKNTEKIRQSLATETQRRAFDKMNAVRYSDIYRTVQDHVSRETLRYDEQSTDAYIKNAQNTAAVNFTDVQPGGQVDQSLFLQEQALTKFGKQYGMPDEVIKQKLSEMHSKTYSGVIGQMLANNMDKQADDYFKANKDKILPEDRSKLETAIEKAVILGEAQRGADNIFSKYSNDRNKSYEEAKKIKDPELRKQTEDQLESMFSRKSLADRSNNQNNYKIASQMVEQGKTPPSIVTQELTADQNTAIKARLKQVMAGVQPNTDWPTYYNLKTMAAGNKNSFLGQNLLEFRHVLADGEFKELTNLQVQLSKNDGSASTELNGFRTSNQIVNDTLQSAGIKTNSKNQNDVKKVALFRRMVDEHVQALQEQTGKKARSEDVQKIADTLLINTVGKSNGWFNISEKKRLFELEYRDVPTAVRSRISKELKSRNKVVSEQNILKYYMIALEREGK